MEEFTVSTTAQLPTLLKAFRKTAKLTQADVAMRLGVTQQTVSAMERNAESVSAERLMKLMGILGVDLVLRARPAASPSSDTGRELQTLDSW